MSALTNYNGVQLLRPAGSKAYTYVTSRVSIDADGAPNAYHPLDTGLDALGNAGYPNGSWRDILAVDSADPGEPYIQVSGPTKGYYVAMTALQDGTRKVTDPARYADAVTVPYVVFPGNFLRAAGTGGVGDFVMAKNMRTGDISSAIVADVAGATDDLGEISIRLGAALGGNNPNPRTGHGSPVGPFRYIVFPYTHETPVWPLTPAQIDQRAQALLAAAGGWAVFEALT